MSYKTTDLVTCPHCGHKQRMPIWGIVNATENKRKKHEIMNGTFFECTCKNCGETNIITYSMLYHDDVNSMMIYHVQSTLGITDAHIAINDRRKYIKDTDDCKIRIVTSPNELKEKIILCENNLDDRIIELMKALIVEELSVRKELGNIDSVLCSVRDDGNFDFDVFADETGTLTVKRSFYDYIEKKTRALLNRQCPNPIEVNMDFALNFLSQNHFQK